MSLHSAVGVNVFKICTLFDHLFFSWLFTVYLKTKNRPFFLNRWWHKMFTEKKKLALKKQQKIPKKFSTWDFCHQCLCFSPKSRLPAVLLCAHWKWKCLCSQVQEHGDGRGDAGLLPASLAQPPGGGAKSRLAQEAAQHHEKLATALVRAALRTARLLQGRRRNQTTGNCKARRTPTYFPTKSLHSLYRVF